MACTNGAPFVSRRMVTSSALLFAATRCFSDLTRFSLIFVSVAIVLSIPSIASL